MAAKKWLQERWEPFFTALVECENEQEVQEICESELDSWRSVRKLTENSMRVPMTDTRREMQARLSGDVLTWALNHLNFSEEQWASVNAPSVQATAERLENVQMIHEPQAIAQKAHELIQSSRWQEVAVGLLVLTGRRLTEILKTASFERKTSCSVLFSGQLKKRGEFPAYEIPTLWRSDECVAALARLRGLLDLSALDIQDVAPKYNQEISTCATQHFSELIPSENGKLHAHIFRAVYTRIAVLCFCPVQVADLHFLAYTQGHFERGASDEVLRNYASEMNYNHYRIMTKDGQIDGRQGTLLEQSGVEVLEVLRKEAGGAMPVSEASEGIVATEQAGADGYSNIRVSKDTRARFDQVGMQLLGVSNLKGLLDQALNAILSRSETSGTSDLSPELIALVNEKLSTGESLSTFIAMAVEKEVKFRAGVERRYAGKDFSSMSSEELKGVKHPDALQERIRRAITAIDRHNASAAPLERWFINPTSVFNLIGGRFPNISAYFTAHQSEVDALNERYNLNSKYNHKPINIGEMVTVE